jgi:hypothetical protein
LKFDVAQAEDMLLYHTYENGNLQYVLNNSLLFSDTLSSDKVCSLLGKKGKIRVKDGSESAVSIKAIRSFDEWQGIVEYRCRFEVKSENDDGLIAVIQNLSFRSDASGCIDYIQVNIHSCS